GVVTLTAARIVGAANVISFEPNPAAAAVARENLAANELPVRLVESAVGAAAGTVSLHVPGWLGASVRWAGRGPSGEVDVVPIREIVEHFRSNVLLLDGEGMEDEILPACPMQGLDKLIVEFHDEHLG